MSPKCLSRIDGISRSRQLLEPGVVEIREEHDQAIGAEPVVHVAADLGVAARQREDVRVGHRGIVSGEPRQRTVSGQRRRDLGEDRRRPDDLGHFRQGLDLRGGVDEGRVQRGVDDRLLGRRGG